MRTIERTGQFKKDFKRELRGRHRATLEADLPTVLAALAQDQPLAPRFRDHALTGNWVDHRDCHIIPSRLRIDTSMLRRPAHQRRRPFGLDTPARSNESVRTRWGIKPDLLLLYQRIDTTILRLVRLGSHAELGM